MDEVIIKDGVAKLFQERCDICGRGTFDAVFNSDPASAHHLDYCSPSDRDKCRDILPIGRSSNRRPKQTLVATTRALAAAVDAEIKSTQQSVSVWAHQSFWILRIFIGFVL